MKIKKKIIISIICSLTLSALVFGILYLNSQTLDGIYSSEKSEILMEDYQGYEYYKDGKVYSINLSDKMDDKVHLMGTYKNIDQYTYFMDAGDENINHRITMGLTGPKCHPELAKKLHIFESTCELNIVFTPWIRSRIKRLVASLQETEL
jgi:hypothetical protein